MRLNGDFGSETKYNTLIKYFSWGLVNQIKNKLIKLKAFNQPQTPGEEVFY